MKSNGMARQRARLEFHLVRERGARFERARGTAHLTGRFDSPCRPARSLLQEGTLTIQSVPRPDPDPGSCIRVKLGRKGRPCASMTRMAEPEDTIDAPEPTSPQSGAEPSHGFQNDWSQTPAAPTPAAPAGFPQDWSQPQASSPFTQDWSKGFDEARLAAPPPPVQQTTPGLFELRPLSTGEVLDRTFTVYRRHFWLFAGIAAFAAGITVLGQIARFSLVGWMPIGKFGSIPKDTAVSSVIGLIQSFIDFTAWSFVQAATITAVSAVYLGHLTSIAAATRSAGRHWFRYALIALWQMWSILWVPLLFIVPAGILMFVFRNSAFAAIAGLLVLVGVLTFVYGIIAYIRNSLAIAASVSEGLKVRRAMRRSKDLIAGHKGRIFLLMLLLFVLALVGSAAQAPLAFLLIKAHAGQRILLVGLTLAMGFIVSTLIGPIGSIALCLFYVDERVRKEGFDVEALMGTSVLGTSVLGTPFPAQPSAATESL